MTIWHSMIVTFPFRFNFHPIIKTKFGSAAHHATNAHQRIVLPRLCVSLMGKKGESIRPTEHAAKRLRSSEKICSTNDMGPSSNLRNAKREKKDRPEAFTSSRSRLSSKEVNILRHAASEPTGLHELDLNDQIETITLHLLAIQSQDLEATLLSIWTRLGMPRENRPNRKILLSKLQSLDGRVIRFWGNRVTLQLATRERRKMLSISVRETVRHARNASTLRGATDAASLGKVLRNAEVRLSELVSENGAASADDCAHVVDEEAKKSGISLNKETAARIRGAVRVFLTVDCVARRLISSNRQATLLRDCDNHGGREGSGNAFDRDLTAVDNEREIALQTCASAYFRAYAPATERDFRYWMGISAADSRRTIASLQSSGVVRSFDTEEGSMLVPTNQDLRTTHLPHSITMHGRFDPILLAHADKTWIVRPEWRSRVWSRNADVSAVVLVHGFVVGVWCVRQDRLIVDLFDDSIDRDALADVTRMATDIATFFYDRFQVVVRHSS